MKKFTKRQIIIGAIAIVLIVAGAVIAGLKIKSSASTVSSSGISVVNYNYQEIPDVYSWFYWYVHSSIQNGIMQTLPDGNFYPNGQGNLLVTRDQAVVYILRAVDSPHCKGSSDVVVDPASPWEYCIETQRYSDVPTIYWAWGYIEKAYQKGLIAGPNPDFYDSFFPSQSITKTDFLTMFSRALGVEAKTLTAPPGYSDNGVNLTRAQVAALLTWNANKAMSVMFSGSLYDSGKGSLANLDGSKIEINDSLGNLICSNPAHYDPNADYDTYKVYYNFNCFYPIQTFMAKYAGKSFSIKITPPNGSGYKEAIVNEDALDNVLIRNDAIIVEWEGKRTITGELQLPQSCLEDIISCSDYYYVWLFAKKVGNKPPPCLTARDCFMFFLNNFGKVGVYSSDGQTLITEDNLSWGESVFGYKFAIDSDPGTAATFVLKLPGLDGSLSQELVTFNPGETTKSQDITYRSGDEALKIYIFENETGLPVGNALVILQGTDPEFNSLGLYQSLTGTGEAGTATEAGIARLADSNPPGTKFPKSVNLNIYPPDYKGLQKRENYPISLDGCIVQHFDIGLDKSHVSTAQKKSSPKVSPTSTKTPTKTPTPRASLNRTPTPTPASPSTSLGTRTPVLERANSAVHRATNAVVTAVKSAAKSVVSRVRNLLHRR